MEKEIVVSDGEKISVEVFRKDGRTDFIPEFAAQIDSFLVQHRSHSILLLRSSKSFEEVVVTEDSDGAVDILAGSVTWQRNYEVLYCKDCKKAQDFTNGAFILNSQVLS